MNCFRSAVGRAAPFLCCITLSVLHFVAPQASAYGRYLAAPANIPGGGAYSTTAPTQFDNVVMMGTDQVGTIQFDYATYQSPAATPTRAGAALSGGFKFDHSKVIAGYTLEWVQIVASTVDGANKWGLPTNRDGGWFPDASPRDRNTTPKFAPSYRFITTALNPTNPPSAAPSPGYGFQDYPNRMFATGNQFWLAELGLVAIQNVPDNTGFRQVNVIDTFRWGYNVTMTPNGVTNNDPFGWSAPTATFLNTLNSYYSGTSPGGIATSKYNFVANQDSFVVLPAPEPSAILIVVAAGPVLLRTRRAARQRLLN